MSLTRFGYDAIVLPRAKPCRRESRARGAAAMWTATQLLRPTKLEGKASTVSMVFHKAEPLALSSEAAPAFGDAVTNAVTTASARGLPKMAHGDGASHTAVARQVLLVASAFCAVSTYIQ